MSRSSFHKKLRVEQLEVKTLLAGDVSVVVDDGDLVITGDEEINEIAIQEGNAPDEIDISRLNASTINGSTDLDFTFSGVTGDVRIDMNGGDDVVMIWDVDLAGDLTMHGGDGDDQFVVGITASGSFLAPVSVADDVTFIGGEGDDLMQMRDYTIEGDLRVETGEGNDVFLAEPRHPININGSSVGDDLVLSTGSGHDQAVVVDVVVDDDLAISVGSGDDALAVIDSEVGGTSLISLDSGFDEVEVGGVDAGEALAVFGSGENIVVLVDVVASHLVSVITAGGNDIVVMEAVDTQLGVVSTDGGADEVAILDSAFALLDVSVGSGDDALELDGVTVDGLALIFGGSGEDELLLGENDIFLGLAFSFEDVLAA